ncbi:hypothetical protein AAG589_03535 [Isoptericola sp. F-RaC21]|uniref:hypothetical protein n=1 Tax=Isoptericola sp. F-RaC21 TaxID=3141452 RepID=UPI00315B9A0A
MLTFDPWIHARPGLQAAARRGDWPGVRAALAGADLGELSWSLARVADLPGAEKWLRRAVQADPSDALAGTTLAARETVLAWQARGSGMGDDLSRRRVRALRRLLLRAEDRLGTVLERDPGFVPAWEVSLRTALGLELDADEARRRYDQVASRAPDHYPAQLEYLEHLLPKWGGSWRAAEDFATECAAAAPAGSTGRALLAAVVIERFVEERRPDPVVAAVPALRRAAEGSVLHPSHVPGAWDAVVHSQLAFLFSMAGEHALAAPHFRALGDRPAAAGWLHLHDAERWYLYERGLALGGRAGRPPGRMPWEPRRWGVGAVAAVVVCAVLTLAGVVGMAWGVRTAVAGDLSTGVGVAIVAVGPFGIGVRGLRTAFGTG